PAAARSPRRPRCWSARDDLEVLAARRSTSRRRHPRFAWLRLRLRRSAARPANRWRHATTDARAWPSSQAGPGTGDRAGAPRPARRSPRRRPPARAVLRRAPRQTRSTSAPAAAAAAPGTPRATTAPRPRRASLLDVDVDPPDLPCRVCGRLVNIGGVAGQLRRSADREGDRIAPGLEVQLLDPALDPHGPGRRDLGELGQRSQGQPRAAAVDEREAAHRNLAGLVDLRAQDPLELGVASVAMAAGLLAAALAVAAQLLEATVGLEHVGRQLGARDLLAVAVAELRARRPHPPHHDRRCGREQQAGRDPPKSAAAGIVLL